MNIKLGSQSYDSEVPPNRRAPRCDQVALSVYVATSIVGRFTRRPSRTDHGHEVPEGSDVDLDLC
jgi:hypothetical protein